MVQFSLTGNVLFDGSSVQSSAAMGKLPCPTLTLLETLFLPKLSQLISDLSDDKVSTHSKICKVVNISWLLYNPISLNEGRLYLNKFLVLSVFGDTKDAHMCP